MFEIENICQSVCFIKFSVWIVGHESSDGSTYENGLKTDRQLEAGPFNLFFFFNLI